MSSIISRLAVAMMHSALAIVLATASTSPALAQVSSSQAASESVPSLASLWNRVTPGDRITVRTTDGTDVNGRFVRASESSVTVAIGDDSRDIPVADVVEVRRYRGGTHLKKWLWISIPLGALQGSVACYSDLHAPPGQNADTGVPCGVGVLVGAAAGGAVGALIGGMTWGSSVVYTISPIASANRLGVFTSVVF